MRFIQIGNRIVNLDQITCVEYTPEDAHPSNPPRVYSSLSVSYADSFNYSMFYEKEADKLWSLLRANATINLGFPNREPIDMSEGEEFLYGLIATLPESPQ